MYGDPYINPTEGCSATLGTPLLHFVYPSISESVQALSKCKIDYSAANEQRARGEKTAATLRKNVDELLSSIIINQPLVAVLLCYFYSENVVSIFFSKIYSKFSIAGAFKRYSSIWETQFG